MSILNATAPLFNNYSHYMPLKNIAQFAFIHRAWNSLGAGPFSKITYLRWDTLPRISHFSVLTFFNYTDRSKIVVDWNDAFESDSLITEYAIYFSSSYGD